jgi:hypothetical protein
MSELTIADWIAIGGTAVTIVGGTATAIGASIGWFAKSFKESVKSLWSAVDGKADKAELDRAEGRIVGEIKALQVHLSSHIENSVQRMHEEMLDSRRAAYERGRDFPMRRRADDPPMWPAESPEADPDPPSGRDLLKAERARVIGETSTRRIEPGDDGPPG